MGKGVTTDMGYLGSGSVVLSSNILQGRGKIFSHPRHPLYPPPIAEECTISKGAKQRGH